MDEHRNKQEQRAEQPSGYSGESPATAGEGETDLRSSTPENQKGQINPTSPTHSTEGPSTNVGAAHSDSRQRQKSGTGDSPTERRPGKEGAHDLRDKEDVA